MITKPYKRGITILSKNTLVTYKDAKINIIDTSGHYDFGGEVQGILNMVDVILLVILLKGQYEHCDFQVIYASGIKGKDGLSPENLAEDLGPLFKSITRYIPEPHIGKNGSLQTLVTSTESRYALQKSRYARVSELYVYEKFFRFLAQRVDDGDICAVCRISDIQIGETIADKVTWKALPSIKVEEPTVKIAFSINTSPFFGREGKYVTSRNLRDRLYRELE
ncbi:hypothetical protein P8452_42106 [Trifolium repens]|nr:hypothetical protein P8452_42106 [Trifolium repens]